MLLVRVMGNASFSFITMTLGREGGQWKVQDQVWRDTEPDANSVYAVLPPEPGAFTRAGSPWDQVAPGMDSSRATQLEWQLKAVFDDSYLYIRIESSAELPAPGSTIAKLPGRWPVLKIDTSDTGEFVLQDEVSIGDQATFDERGRANSHRAFAAYSLRLGRKQNQYEVFHTSAGLHPSPLIKVAGRELRHARTLGDHGHYGFARNQDDARRCAVAKLGVQHAGPKISSLGADHRLLGNCRPSPMRHDQKACPLCDETTKLPVSP